MNYKKAFYVLLIILLGLVAVAGFTSAERGEQSLSRFERELLQEMNSQTRALESIASQMPRMR